MGRTEEILSKRASLRPVIMIFVTVGTHEQPFDRLVKEIDKLKGKNIITEQVFIQTGYSVYKPKFCEYEEFIKFNEMMEMIKKARIVITHGGPGSIMPVLYNGKVPIVVPRQKKHGEHVDAHQVHFCKKLEEKGKILAVYKIEEIENKIKNYESFANKLIDIKKKKEDHMEKLKNISEAMDELCKKLLKNRKY